MANELLVFLTAMAPVAELRGAIPLGFLAGLSPIKVFLLSFIGNIIPVPFLILFSRPVIRYLKRIKPLEKVLTFFENRATKKANKIKGYVALGLFLFVAVPLPGTGAWTGSLIAAVLNMRLKYAIPIITVGVLVAGVIIMALSLGTVHFIGI
ncbi:MAG: small multi-drug export protein [Clostridiaceae bacterium]|jgi:uncharacterized membrane protein|nr:small multi-drug export protein [Clostridiaceae bacterium]